MQEQQQQHQKDSPRPGTAVDPALLVIWAAALSFEGGATAGAWVGAGAAGATTCCCCCSLDEEEESHEGVSAVGTGAGGTGGGTEGAGAVGGAA